MANVVNNTTQQSLFDSASIKVNFPSISESGADDYLAKGADIIKAFNALNELSNAIAPIFSTGSPEGVVKSNYSQLYIDTASNTWYSNPNLGANTGWVAK